VWKIKLSFSLPTATVRFSQRLAQCSPERRRCQTDRVERNTPPGALPCSADSRVGVSTLPHSKHGSSGVLKTVLQTAQKGVESL